MLGFSLCGEGECIERTGGGAKMAAGEMQIDRRFLKVAMTEQHLDGAQVGAALSRLEYGPPSVGCRFR